MNSILQNITGTNFMKKKQAPFIQQNSTGADVGSTAMQQLE
jgi:hypothetical protein